MKLRDWLDRVDDRLGRIDLRQAEHHATLQEHMRRSLANEEAVQLLRAEIAPIKTHVAVVAALVKVVGLTGTLIGIATGVAKLAGWI